jgi:type VI secretion system Hcp family effector
MQRRIPLLPLLALPLVLAGSTTGALAVTEVYVCIQGIAGDSQVQSDCVDVHEFHHLVQGEPGNTRHEAIVFVKKRNDRSTVDLLRALHMTEPHDMSFHFQRGHPEPTEYYRIELHDAIVVAIEPWSRDGGSGVEELERVRVSYSDMQLLYTEPSKSGDPRKKGHILRAP